jgi:hypothetical protein
MVRNVHVWILAALVLAGTAAPAVSMATDATATADPDARLTATEYEGDAAVTGVGEGLTLW